MSKQLERLRKHARAGLSKAQAADLEGVSHKVAYEALLGTDLKWARGIKHWQPKGLDGPRLKSLQSIVESHLTALRNTYPLDEVCHMTGMNKGEQSQAINHTDVCYNWTVGQISRIAEARGLTYFDIMDEVNKARLEAESMQRGT